MNLFEYIRNLIDDLRTPVAAPTHIPREETEPIPASEVTDD